MSVTEEEIITCRACLTNIGNFVSVYCTLIQKNIDLQLTLNDCWNYCMRSSDEKNMADVVDVLPKYICMKCSEDLQNAYNFLKTARQTLVTLRRQIMVENCENAETSELSEVGRNDEWEIVEKEVEKVISENCDLLESDIANHLEEDVQLKSSEWNEEWTLDIDKLIEYDEDEDLDAADESYESPATNMEELKENETIASLKSQRKFRVEEVEDKIAITCIQCAVDFRNYRRFEDHMYEHRSMQPYACSMCTQKLRNVKGMVQHYSKSHGVNPTLDQLQPKSCDSNALGPTDFEQRTMYMCSHCSYEHAEFKAIKQHMRNMHDSTDLKHIIKKLPYQCPKCLRCFTSRDKVIKHAEYEHSNIIYSTAVRIRKHVVCNKCDKKYELSQRKRHELRCDGKMKTYQCKICNEIFANRTKLMNHKREMHSFDPQADSPFRCEICGNTYRTRIQLRFHVKRHDARNFKCNQCNRTFIRHHDLKKHQLIHTGELPYKCDICSASYRYTHALRDHKERIHLNETFICKVSGCEAQFRTRSQLNDHKYKHIGNPYKCERCSKDFLRRESLRRHSKAVHKICPTEEELTKIFQQHMGRYNTHDIRKMADIEASVN
ncbi:zinc finger protein 431 [Eurosta solidaginis]|uniref:zinc finger protein 431 n=1 Tax=Eurosta solidaginis TaxID=178769 RepID=UPI0035313A15